MTQAASVSTTSQAPLVCPVVPVHNRRELTLRFLEAFASVTYPNTRIIVVDDGSRDETAAAVRAAHPEVIVLRGDGTLWWAGATNMGVRHALQLGAAYVLTINDDATFEPDFLDVLVRTAEADHRRIVGSRLQRSDEPGRVRALGASVVFRGHQLFRLNHFDDTWSSIREATPDPLPVQTIPGNGALVPRAVFDRIGLYDARNLPHYHADTDLVLRAGRAGFRPVVATGAVVYDQMGQPPSAVRLRDVILSRRSDRYWRAVLASVWRHGPRWKLPWLAATSWLPFLLPRVCQEAIRSRISRRRRAMAS